MLDTGMNQLVALFSSLLRIILLLVGIYLALALTLTGVQGANAFLAANNYPCLEVISLLVVLVPPIGILYGQHIRRYFWQRMGHYNWIILGVSLIVGISLAFISTGYFSELEGADACQVPASTLGITTYILGTSVVTAILAFIGVDFGVTLKHLSLKINHPRPAPRAPRKKKRAKRRR